MGFELTTFELGSRYFEHLKPYLEGKTIFSQGKKYFLLLRMVRPFQRGYVRYGLYMEKIFSSTKGAISEASIPPPYTMQTLCKHT